MGRARRKSTGRVDKKTGRRPLPVPFIRQDFTRKATMEGSVRRVTLHQLAVMLWHLYIVSSDPDLGYIDSDINFRDFTQNNSILKKFVPISKSDLERLLWASHTAHQAGLFWSPDGKDLQSFINNVIIPKEEVFDYKWNLIRSKK